MKLYDVSVTFRMPVVAKDETHALDHARFAVLMGDDPKPSSHTVKAIKTRAYLPHNWEGEVHPMGRDGWGSNTCEDYLDD